MKSGKLRVNRNRLLNFKVGDEIENYIFLSDPKKKGSRGKLATRLGDGGSGVVYLVGQKLHKSYQIDRAIKFFVYRPDIAKRFNKSVAVSQKEFIREIASFSQLSHEGLVKIIDAGIYSDATRRDPFPYIVTEFVKGVTLKQFIEAPLDARKSDPTSRFRRDIVGNPERVLTMLIQIARAIKFMHDRNFYHCDIAPKNIFLKEEEGFRPIIGDLGLGAFLADVKKNVRVAGTRKYMPKEVERHWTKIVPWNTYVKFHPRWDLFSFAQTALEFSELIPDTRRIRWRTPLVESLKKCLSGEKFHSIDEIIDQLEWLSPVGQVPELAPSLAGQQKKIIPVDSLIISDRVRKLMNHPAVLRLAKIHQLTTARYVFPGAMHTRYEHALGTMETMRRYVSALKDSPDFLTRFNPALIETALICALLANITRHPLRNVLGEIKGVVPQYESNFDDKDLFEELFRETRNANHQTLQDLIERDFPNVDCEVVKKITVGSSEECNTPEERLVYSLLHCSLDVRVTDFVRRDSIHLGLSGFTFDLDDLLGQLTVHDERLALRVSGVGSAEQLITMRYWLFNRIYWNAPNRAFVSMLRYCLFRLAKNTNFVKQLRLVILKKNEEELLHFCLEHAKAIKNREVQGILKNLCHPEQPLFRPILQISPKETPDLTNLCKKIGDMDFGKMIHLADQIESHLKKKFPHLKSNGHRRMLLVDMPPDEKAAGNKLGGDIMVIRPDDNKQSLDEASEIVKGVMSSFTHYLRRVRIFCHPSILQNQDRDFKDKLVDGVNHALRAIL